MLLHTKNTVGELGLKKLYEDRPCPELGRRPVIIFLFLALELSLRSMIQVMLQSHQSDDDRLSLTGIPVLPRRDPPGSVSRLHFQQFQSCV